jgi:2,4-dienoyl-CoA reductase-like NADH-dependent reductase (Old Yellow Enzyme family)
MAKASDPINIGPMRLKNRLVGAPMLTSAWVVPILAAPVAHT